jgi:hypothetical protein
VATVKKRFQNGRTGGHEQLQAYLEPAADALQPLNKSGG